MKLYVVRHGQTNYNIANKVCGKSDVELTDLGKQQAKKASEQLQDVYLDLKLLHHKKEHISLNLHTLFVIIFIICIFSKQALYLLVRFLRKFLCDKYFCPGFFRIIRSVS